MIMAREVERWVGVFAAYPRQRKLCDQHVSGDAMHITWRSYATSDSLAKVVEFYESDQKTRAAIDEKTGARKFVAAADSDIILSIYEAAAATKIPTCPEGATRKGDNTVILVSQAMRSRK